MKNILIATMFVLAALSVGSINAQDFQDKLIKSDTLISGTDSLVIDTLKGNYSYVYVMVIDTQATAADTVVFETWSQKDAAWIRVGAINCYDNSNVTAASVLVNAARMFLILDNDIYIFRQRLVSHRTGHRIFTSLKCVNRP